MSSPSPPHSIEVWLELEVNKDPVPRSQPQCMGSKGKHRNNGMHLASAPPHGKLWSHRPGRVRVKRVGKREKNGMNTLKFRTSLSYVSLSIETSSEPLKDSG